ncbi:MAG TPA: hypothetical protein EYP30_07565 [Archaeoglobaceae archaeon]|nr:hypothetical protein [Archaeoglobaceae archaeon]
MQILEVNLKKHEVKVREAEKDEYHFIGGKGIGFSIFSKYLSSDILIFALGPLTGLKMSGMAKCAAVFKSPQTGLVAESSCGGFFGVELRRAGFTAVLIKGISNKPVILKIDNESAELLDARNLWGKDTFETEDEIKADFGKRYKVACIGQAGENLVKFACIEHAKGREFGRCGGGAVMGSMKLKAVAVKGDKDVESEITDYERYSELKEEFEEKIVKGLRGLTETGTPRMLPIVNEAGVLPTGYWRDGEFEAVEEIMDDLNKIHKRKRACYACRVACGKISKFNGNEVDGPEYETIFSFGSLCNIKDLNVIAEANLLCDRFGMDTISAGNVVAYYLNSTGRLGDGEIVPELLKKIAYRKGEGDRLAEGLKEFSSIHIKGLEIPGYDPRGLYGTAIGYAVCYRGGCHIKHVMHRPNLDGEVDRFRPDGQAELLVEVEDFYGFTDSMVICRFVTLPKGVLRQKEVAELYNVVTGSNFTKKDVMKKGREVINLSRKINELLGLSRKDDKLPEFFFREPLGKGNSEGRVVNKKDFEKMLEEYYRLRGWHEV